MTHLVIAAQMFGEKRYDLVHRLVFCEQVSDVRAAIAREKQLKHWKRVRKLELVGSANPEWRDLSG